MGKKEKTKTKSGTPLRILLIVVAFIIVILLGVYIYGKSLGGSAKDKNNKNEIMVTIEKGSTTAGIGKLLQDKGIIKSQKDFKLYTTLNRYDGLYQAGSYAFSPSMTTDTIAKALRTGKTNDITFTIPEGTWQIGRASCRERV